MTRSRILAAAVVLTVAATVWFAISFAGAGRVPAGPGGRDRVVVPAAQREGRARAGVRFVGALVLITAGAGAASRFVRD